MRAYLTTHYGRLKTTLKENRRKVKIKTSNEKSLYHNLEGHVQKVRGVYFEVLTSWPRSRIAT